MSPYLALTGASGYIGKYLAESLAGTSPPIRALLRRGDVSLPMGVDCRVLPAFTEKNLIEALEGVESVIHLAGRAHVFRESDASPEKAYFAANTELTLALGRAAAAVGVKRFVFMSTVKVYGDTPECVLNEDVPARPDDAYGRSKLEAENGLRRLAQSSDMAVTIVRSPLVYGPGCTGNVRRLSRLLARGVPLPFGAVENRRSMIGVQNLVDILVRAASDKRAENKTFLVSDGLPVSTPDMIHSLSEGLGVRPRLIGVSPRLLCALGNAVGFGAEVKRLCGSLEVDTQKLCDQLAWVPRTSTHEGLVETGRSFRIRAD